MPPDWQIKKLNAVQFTELVKQAKINGWVHNGNPHVRTFKKGEQTVSY